MGNQNVRSGNHRELMIKPMEDGSFQYLSNKVISSDQNANAGWYMPRLTEEEWEENYSNN